MHFSSKMTTIIYYCLNQIRVYQNSVLGFESNDKYSLKCFQFFFADTRHHCIGAGGMKCVHIYYDYYMDSI